MHQIPILVDPHLLLKRLLKEERELELRLAELESRTRKFEDIERPAFESWLRLELGPRMITLDELFQQIRERRLFVQRIQEIIESERLSPREALYRATRGQEQGQGQGQEQGQGQGQEQGQGQGEGEGQGQDWDPEEIEARRQAKREAKRAARRERKKQNESNPDPSRAEAARPGTSRLVSLYRALARRLHPDSPLAIQGLPPVQIQALWSEVQAAYVSANSERLLAIAAWLDQGSDGSEGGEGGGGGLSFSVLSFSERFERLRSMKKSCTRIEVKLKQLAAHPAWEFERVRGKARRKLRQKAAHELEDDIAETREVLDALDDIIESIGSPKAPKSSKR